MNCCQLTNVLQGCCHDGLSLYDVDIKVGERVIPLKDIKVEIDKDRAQIILEEEDPNG